MDLSIIIVSWNTRDLLAECLQSVCGTVQDLPFELLVVDNASTDGSAAMAQELFPDVLLIENEENVGFARATNQAIGRSRGRFVLLLNSDALVVGDAVEQMMKLMDARPDAGVVGPRLTGANGRPQMDHGPLPTLALEIRSLLGLDKLFWLRFADRSAKETGWVSGACMMARRQALDQVGLLDEGYFMFSEEIDLCHRTWKGGWKVVYLPTAQVIHVEGASTGWTPDRYLMLYRSKMRYLAKHYGPCTAQSLLRAMRFSAGLKVAWYSLLRWITLGKVHKDDFWRSVAGGLRQLPT